MNKHDSEPFNNDDMQGFEDDDDLSVTYDDADEYDEADDDEEYDEDEEEYEDDDDEEYDEDEDEDEDDEGSEYKKSTANLRFIALLVVPACILLFALTRLNTSNDGDSLPVNMADMTTSPQSYESDTATDTVEVSTDVTPEVTTTAWDDGVGQLVTDANNNPVIDPDVTTIITETAAPTDSTAETVATAATAASTASSTVAVTGISLSTYEVNIIVGASEMPYVTMMPWNATDLSEIWTSSDSTIATVDSKGNIYGISEGSCTVTVKSASNQTVSASVKVNVTALFEAPTVTEPTSFNNIIIVNKSYPCPKDYNPYNGGLSPDVTAAYNKMSADASAQGLTLTMSSGYRSYDYQAQLYNNYVNSDGQAAADRYSARPGYSEHHTGLAFDLAPVDNSFADTPEGKWVAANCYKYGFIIRYPEDKEDITGYMYEPWHLRYVGVELATALYNNNMCLEEYFGITSQYAQ